LSERDSQLRRTLFRLSMMTGNPIEWFARLPLRELEKWIDDILCVLNEMREENDSGQ